MELIKSELIPLFESFKDDPQFTFKCLSAAVMFSAALPDKEQVTELAKWTSEYVNGVLKQRSVGVKVVIDGRAKEGELIKVTVVGDLNFANASPVSDTNKATFEELCLPIDQFFDKIWNVESFNIKLGADISKSVDLAFVARVVAKTVFDAVKKSRTDMTNEIAFNICLDIIDKYPQVPQLIHVRFLKRLNGEIAKMLTDDVKTGIIKSIITEGV